MLIKLDQNRSEAVRLNPPGGPGAALQVRLHVRPHLRLLVGGVLAPAAVQREQAALPLPVLRHVTLEEGVAFRLKAADVAPEEEQGPECFEKPEL